MKIKDFNTNVEPEVSITNNITKDISRNTNKPLTEVYVRALDIGKTIEQHKSDNKLAVHTWAGDIYSTKPKLGRIK